MRIAIFVIAAINLAIWAYGAIAGPSMPDGIGGDTFWTLLGIMLAIITTPALILAATGRFLKVAMTLALLPELLLILSWIMGW